MLSCMPRHVQDMTLNMQDFASMGTHRGEAAAHLVKAHCREDGDAGAAADAGHAVHLPRA